MIEKFLSIKALILIPIIGCLIILLPLFPKDSKVIRRFAKGVSFINLLYSICIIAYFNPELYGVSYEETLKDALGDLNIPVIFDSDIGHVSPQMSIVSGGILEITSKNGKGTIKNYFE